MRACMCVCVRACMYSCAQALVARGHGKLAQHVKGVHTFGGHALVYVCVIVHNQSMLTKMVKLAQGHS